MANRCTYPPTGGFLFPLSTSHPSHPVFAVPTSENQCHTLACTLVRSSQAMDDQQTNLLFQLLDDPERDPDTLAYLAVDCFGSRIGQVLPSTFVGVHHGAVVVDLSAFTPLTGASCVRIVYFTLSQLQQLPHLLDFPNIIRTV